MDKEKFEKDMAAFHFGQHQDVLIYLSQLDASGWTIEDVKEWIDGQREKLTSRPIRAAVFKCPDCQSPMQLLRVNVSPATQTNDSSKSVWLCTNKKCMNTIYNTESVEKILKNKGKYKEKKNGAT
jgi:predicted RNA-binding protein YlxR (DUF448 family)